MKTNILDDVANYYSAKLAKHGETAKGADWNGEQSQTLRFVQLAQVINPALPFSLQDLGCGYGAMLDYLNQHFHDFLYYGYDVSPDMVQAAQARYQDQSHASFKTTALPDINVDYGIASGIFNVRLGRTDAEWLNYLEETLDTLNRTSTKGFAFNCLTSYSDADKMRDYLYYADPCLLFDLCKRRFSRHVALLHDYGLYEFTILVKKIL